MRASVAQLLGKTRDSRLIGEYAWIIYYDKEDRVKIAALDALKDIGEELCTPPMIEALKDDSAAVRTHAATRLAEAASHRIEGTEHGGQEAYTKWSGWWRAEKLPKYANHEGLEKLKKCSDVASLLAIAGSGDMAGGEVRASAVSLLSTMPGERAKDAFRKCLNSPDEMVCIAAVNSVLAGKLTDYVEDIEKLAENSTSEAVRAKAARALSKLRER